jgi:hypothetical protein
MWTNRWSNFQQVYWGVRTVGPLWDKNITRTKRFMGPRIKHAGRIVTRTKGGRMKDQGTIKNLAAASQLHLVYISSISWSL